MLFLSAAFQSHAATLDRAGLDTGLSTVQNEVKLVQDDQKAEKIIIVVVAVDEDGDGTIDVIYVFIYVEYIQ